MPKTHRPGHQWLSRSIPKFYPLEPKTSVLFGSDDRRVSETSLFLQPFSSIEYAAINSTEVKWYWIWLAMLPIAVGLIFEPRSRQLSIITGYLKWIHQTAIHKISLHCLPYRHQALNKATIRVFHPRVQTHMDCTFQCFSIQRFFGDGINVWVQTAIVAHYHTAFSPKCGANHCPSTGISCEAAKPNWSKIPPQAAMVSVWSTICKASGFLVR